MSPLPRKKRDEPEDEPELDILVELDNPEAQKQQQYRIDMLVRTAGFDHWHATRIASIPGVDWREAAKLRANKCPQKLIYEILRTDPWKTRTSA